MTFTIIKATPGLTTKEKILELLEKSPDGLTVKQLSDLLNRPISMIQTCLKLLVSCKKVTSKKTGMIKYYYLQKS
ncbi:MAG: helix-turn-helix domain-containing protein [Crocosphaera sp.]